MKEKVFFFRSPSLSETTERADETKCRQRRMIPFLLFESQKSESETIRDADLFSHLLPSRRSVISVFPLPNARHEKEGERESKATTMPAFE